MKRYFPQHIFWKSFWSHLTGFIVFLGLVILFEYIFTQNYFDGQETLNSVLFYKLIPTIFILIVISSLWFAYKTVKPLGPIIHSVRNMVFKKNLMQWTHDESIYDEESGEFYELEEALARVRKKLKKKYIQLEIMQEESQTILSAVGDGVVSVDSQQKFLYYNSNFASQFLPTSEKRKSIYLSEALREPDILAHFNNSLTSGQVSHGIIEWESTTLESTKLYLKLVVTPLIKADDNIIYGAIGVFHDITPLKLAEKLRIDFLSNASHELRTPLTSIKGYVDLLKELVTEKNDSALSNCADIISKNVNRLVDLVNDLFLISKMESNPELYQEEINTFEISNDILDELKHQYFKKKQVIKISAGAPTLFADPVKVGQVLRNLLSNAIRYVPDEGLIEIIWEEAHDGILLRVKDNGPGVPLANQNRIFERFYRVDKGRSREVGGTGLGLSIVKHIMQAHQGWVKLISHPHQGSEFQCFFPK